MTIQVINTGTSANSGNGDSLRVAFTKVNNNFAELVDAIASPFDQSLNTTDNVEFLNLNISSGTVIAKTLSAGGYPLDSNGQAFIRYDMTESPALIVSNYTPNQRAEIVIRGYGQNKTGASTVTSGASILILESSRGSHLTTSATKNSDLLGFIGIGGYDGDKWNCSDRGLASSCIYWIASENWNYQGNTATNVGTRMNMRVHPQGIKSIDDSSLMNHYTQSWQSNTNNPPTLVITNGAVVTPILENSAGSEQYVGFGASTFRWQNGTMILHGVTIHDSASFTGNINGTILTVDSINTGVLSVGQQLTGTGILFNTKITGLGSGVGGTGTYIVNNSQTVASSTIIAGPDNTTLRGTNIISIAGHRTSGVSGQRNPLMIGDHLGQFNFRGQFSPQSSTSGVIGSTIITEALDNFSTSTYGTRFLIETVNSGTTVMSNRLSLDNLNANINSDTITLANASSSTIAVFSTTATVLHNSLLPAQDLTYDLGSTSSQWRSIYVGTGTIYIGGVAIGVNQDDYVTVDGNPVITVSTAGTLTVQGNTDVVLGSVIISDTAPAASTPGSQWFNSVEGRTYIAYDGVWVDANPTVLPPDDINPTFESITFNDATVQTTAWPGTLSYNDLTDKPIVNAFVGGGGASTWLTAD